MRSVHVEFPGSQKSKLAARLDIPESEPTAYAIFAHCFTCTKDVYAASRICKKLADGGVATLRFDFTGLGESAGDFADTNFTSNMEDLLAASDWLSLNHKPASMLIGHSLGGAAVLRMAGLLKDVKVVATIAAPAEPAHITHMFLGRTAEIEDKGEAHIELAGRTFRIRKQFLDDIATHTLDDSISTLHKALIVFHSPRDETVGIENAAKIFAAARHPKSFISLDNADHLLTRREDAAYVAQILSAWAARYL